MPAEIALGERLVDAAAFRRLADVPPELEWFANIATANSRRPCAAGGSWLSRNRVTARLPDQRQGLLPSCPPMARPAC